MYQQQVYISTTLKKSVTNGKIFKSPVVQRDSNVSITDSINTPAVELNVIAELFCRVTGKII
jgi:hypothetical protein